MIQVKQSNVKFKYNDSGNIKYSPLLDLLIVDHQSEYIDQAKNKIQGIVNQINNNSSVINNLCNGYESDQNYNIGDYVFYNGEMYCCVEAIQNSGENFPQNKFKKVIVSDQLLKIKNEQLDRIKKILQCQDSEEVIFDIEEFIDNTYIKYASGQEGTDSDYYATDYIDVKDCLKLKYSRSVSSGPIPTVGMAFYDKDKYFILNSGQSILPQGNSKTLEQISVPPEAYYARFTGRSNSISKESFQLIKINKIADRINNVNDRVNNTNDRIDNLSNNLSNLYLQNKTYQVGDYCIKDDKLYQCFIMVEQAQNENWDNVKNNFRQIKIDKELKKLKNFKTKFSDWQSGNYGSSQTESEGVLQRINKGRSLYDYYLGIPCKQGDIFLIKKAKSHSNVRGYVFAKKDTDNYYLTYLANHNWCAPKDTEFTNLILTAPEGAEYLFVTFGISEDNTSWINDDRYATYYINPLAFQIIKILESISALYSEQETYNTDDYCIYDGKLYRCINDEVVNSPQDENSWQETTLISYISSLKNKINNLTANDIAYNSSDSSSLNNTVGNKFSTIDSEIENINTNLNNLTTVNDTRLSTLQSNEQNINDNIEDINNNIEDMNEDISSLKVNKISIPLNANNGDILVKTSNGLQWSNVLAQMTINTDVANAIDNAVGDWLDDHIETSQGTQSTIAITSDLTSTNAAAQAKAAGDLIIVDSTQPSETNNKIWINQGTNVEQVSLSTYEDLTNIVADQYSNKAYKNGEYFINNGILYRVTADIAAVDNININAVSKTQVTAGAEIGVMRNTVNGYLDAVGIVTANGKNWESGTIQSANGKEAPSSNKIRAKTFFQMPADGIVIADGYKAQIFVYTSNSASSYHGVFNGSGYNASAYWLAGTVLTSLIPAEYYVRLVLATVDESTSIATTDASNLTFVSYTDKQLGTEGKSADSKAVKNELDKKADAGSVNILTTLVDKSVSKKTEINFSQYTAINGYINSSNVYVNPGSFNSFMIPVNGALKLFVKANSTNSAVISFLTTDTLVEDSSPAFSEDEPERILIAAGEEETFAIPSNAEFVFVHNRGASSSVSYKPSKLEFTSVYDMEEMTDSVNLLTQFMRKSLIEKAVDIDDYQKVVGFINSNNVYKKTNGFTSDFVPLDDCVKIYVKANPNSGAVVSFLTTNTMTPDSTAPFSVKYPERKTIAAGEDEIFDVPDDAKYAFIHNKGQSSTVYKPSTVKLYVVRPTNELIEKLRADILNSLGFVGDTTGHDVPENRGVLNAYKKARQLLTIPWTAKGDVPTHKVIYPSGNYDEINAGDDCTGVPYSSAKEHSKYVGLMVSLRTFMTAVNNPYSLLYTETIYGGASASEYGFTYHGTNCSSYFGIVCSMLVEYALGFNEYYDTDYYDYLCRTGVLEKVYDQSAYGLKLMDIYWRDGHVKLITDIIRNARGVPTRVTTTESAAVFPYEKNQTPAEFNQMLANQNGIIYRYTGLYKNLDYTPSDFVAVEDEVAPGYTYNDDICTFAGDYAIFHANDVIYINYTLGSYTGMELYKDDTLIQTYSLNDASQHALNVSSQCSGYGTYKARLIGTGNPSEYTYFVVMDTNVSNVTYENGAVSFAFSSTNATPIYAQICTDGGAPLAHYVFTADDLEDGTCSFDPYALRYEQYRKASYPSTAYLRVFFRHSWGMTSGAMILLWGTESEEEVT